MLRNDKQKEAIQKWLELNNKAGFLGGYPVGRSYIDTRQKASKQEKEFVEYDKWIIKEFPELQGYGKEKLKELI